MTDTTTNEAPQAVKKPKPKGRKKGSVDLSAGTLDKALILTPLEKEFIDAYTRDWNIKKACKTLNISSEVATNIISGRNVQRAIKKIRFFEAQGALTYESVGKREVITEYAKVAFADPAECFDANGMLKNIHDIPEDVRRSIASIKHTENGPEVKFWPKVEALNSLSKIMGMFVTRIETKGQVRYIVDAPMPAQDADAWESTLHAELVASDRSEQQALITKEDNHASDS